MRIAHAFLWVEIVPHASVAATLAMAATATHLYISGPNDSGYYTGDEPATTVSYALVNGRIGSRPDRIYPTNTQGPMPLDAAGDLYASEGDCSVAEYERDSTTVKRTVNVAFDPSAA